MLGDVGRCWEMLGDVGRCWVLFNAKPTGQRSVEIPNENKTTFPD